MLITLCLDKAKQGNYWHLCQENKKAKQRAQAVKTGALSAIQ